MPHREQRTLEGLHDLLELMHADMHQILDGQTLAKQERHRIMSLASDIKAMQADTLARITANTNATSALTDYIATLKQKNTELQTALDQAIANGATSAELQEIADGFKALNDSIDADTAAEAALAGTPAAEPPAQP